MSYDESGSPKMLRSLKVKKHQERIAELNIEIEAVEQAMDREEFRVRWVRLKAIVERLSNERQDLLKRV